MPFLYDFFFEYYAHLRDLLSFPTRRSSDLRSGAAAVYGVNFSRLAGIKYKYDRENFFRRNSNIPPTGKSSRSEEHTSELQSHSDLVCRLLLEKKKHWVR